MSSKKSKKNNIYKFKKAKPNKQLQKEKKILTISERLKRVMLVFFFALALLIIRLGWLQIVQGAELKEAMDSQSIKDQIISPKRGTIYDATGKALARSAQVDTVTINPNSIVVLNNEDEIDEEKTKQLKEKVAKAFADIFELDYKETLKKVSNDEEIETIARKVEKDKIDKLKQWMNDNEIYRGINIDEDSKRYYPYNNLASNLLGFCGTDNQGLEGLEAQWDSILTGTPGKIINSQDALQELIPDEDQKYYEAENGNDITLTLDANIQGIAEKYLKQACEENNCTNGGNVIIMNPNNGDVLAMATYPDYNLNDPFTPTHISEEEWKKMNEEDSIELLQTTWNNRAITSTYEPGSVFKIITAAVGLEEDIVEPDKSGEFYCNGEEKLTDTVIKCHDGSQHGSQSLREALMNSCNPAFMQLGRKIGASTLYKYYNAFGFFDITNFASGGEESGVFWDLDDVGEVELATMSFGQRFRITPLQMITAVSAVANDGVLMQPRIVKEITNTDTGAVTTIEPIAVRQVISKETSDKLLDMLTTVVEEGTGKYAQVKGYTVAGKTGTSEPDPSDESQTYVVSFAAISPTENPEVVILVTLYGPDAQGGSHSGSTQAGPVVGQILKEVLPYLGIPSDTTESADTIETTSLPNVKNKTISEAEKILERAGFNCNIYGDEKDIVTDQMPKEGTSLVSGAIVCLYTEGNDTRVSQTVPSLKEMTYTEAKAELKKHNLNIKASGSGIVISQDISAGTEVEEGTVINITLQNEIIE